MPHFAVATALDRMQKNAHTSDMTHDAISARQQREAIKYETAKAIRKTLDDAREAYGADEWDDDALEAAVLELVEEEDP